MNTSDAPDSCAHFKSDFSFSGERIGSFSNTPVAIVPSLKPTLCACFLTKRVSNLLILFQTVTPNDLVTILE